MFAKFILLAVLSLVLSACATTPDSNALKQSEAYYKLGMAYFQNDQLNEAFIEFQKSINFNPGNKESLNYLGFISSIFRRHDEAISYYKRAIAADPYYSEAMNNLGVLYLELERWDEAITYFTSALKNKMYRTPEKAFANMGYAYYKKGDYKNAITSLKDANLRNPLFTHSIYTLGLVYVMLGNDEKAIEEFERAIGIMPYYIDAHWELANAYLRTKKNSLALEHFKIVAAKDSDPARSRKALEFLDLLKQ